MVNLEMRDIDVSDDNVLLDQVMSSHGVTVTQLALESGRSASTIYKYLSGDMTTPTIIWRSIYRLTGDHRIVELLLGSTDFVFVPIEPEVNKLDPHDLLMMRKEQLNFEQAVVEILLDGDPGKREMAKLEEINKVFPRMVACAAGIREAINREYGFETGR